MSFEECLDVEPKNTNLASAESLEDFQEALTAIAVAHLKTMLQANALPTGSDSIKTFEDLYLRACLPLSGRKKSFELQTFLQFYCFEKDLYGRSSIDENPYSDGFKAGYPEHRYPVYEALIAVIKEAAAHKLMPDIKTEIEAQAASMEPYLVYSFGRDLAETAPKFAQRVVSLLEGAESGYERLKRFMNQIAR